MKAKTKARRENGDSQPFGADRLCGARARGATVACTVWRRTRQRAEGGTQATPAPPGNKCRQKGSTFPIRPRPRSPQIPILQRDRGLRPSAEDRMPDVPPPRHKPREAFDSGQEARRAGREPGVRRPWEERHKHSPTETPLQEDSGKQPCATPSTDLPDVRDVVVQPRSWSFAPTSSRS